MAVHTRDGSAELDTKLVHASEVKILASWLSTATLLSQTRSLGSSEKGTKPNTVPNSPQFRNAQIAYCHVTMRAHVRTVRLTEGGGQVQYSTSTRELTMAGRGSEVAGVDQYQWERLPDMSNARCYTTGAYHQGKLYVLGTYVRGVGSSKRECTTR